MMRVRNLDGLWTSQYPEVEVGGKARSHPQAAQRPVTLSRSPITPAFEGVKSQSRIFMKAISIVAITRKQETGTLVYFNAHASCTLLQR